jgi:flagellar hook-length control protein FliK
VPSATFVSQHADVRQALEAALPRLREMMAENGISLGSATVSADTSQQQGGFERQECNGYTDRSPLSRKYGST